MSFRLSSWMRFLPVVLLLGATAVALQARNWAEILPPHDDLSTFPMQIGEWHGTERGLSAAELEVLGPGQFMVRDYEAPMEPPVNLYIAYFPSQRTGDTIHSPKNCLPGAGWSPTESGHMTIPRSDGTNMVVNRYIVSKGESRAFVLYWYQSHGRVIASEYWAKFYLIADAIRLNRTDGALLRVVIPLSNKDTDEVAQSKAMAFVHQILPMLDTYIPR